MFDSGQPESDWQNGTPQSMHRADWYLSSSSFSRLDSSAQSLTRVLAVRYFSARRWYFMKPRVLSSTSFFFLSAAWSPTLSSRSCSAPAALLSFLCSFFATCIVGRLYSARLASAALAASSSSTRL